MKKLNISTRKLSILFFVTLLFSSFILFQNCSKQKFSADYSNTSLSTDAVFYTNNKIVPIKLVINSPFAERFDQMRASLDQDMTDVPWQPIADTILFDLNNEFASDGSKDGPKTVFIEVHQSGAETLTLPITQNIFLDTQAPTLEGSGILVQGIQGQTIEMGQSVELKWKMVDKIASSGESSGIDPAQGFRWGLSQSEDCTVAHNTQTSEWMTPRESLEVSWPEPDPLHAFYFCLYGKDRAQNTGVLLSQPMSSLWNVYVGDNNQGNGSSVTSPKVRFKRPSFLFLDPDRNIHVKDEDFVNWRRIGDPIRDPARTIESFAQNSEFPDFPTSPVVYDSSGTAYYAVGTNIQMLLKNSTKSQRIIQGLGPSSLAIRNYQGTSRLLIYQYSAALMEDPASKSYLFEIPLSNIATLNSKILTLTDLIAGYKIAGSGTIAGTKYVIPSEVILSKNDPVDNLHSLSLPRSVTTSDSGEIFLSTVTDGAGRGYGHHTVRRLTPLADGTFKQTIIARDSWIGQLAYHKQIKSDGSTLEILAGGGVYQPVIINLESGLVSHPFTGFAELGGSGIAINTQPTGLDYDFYITADSTSQIFHYTSDYKLIEIFGRPVYDDIQDPLATVIGNPDGIVQEPNGAFYFIDSQNALVNTVSKDGVLTKVTGQVQNYKAKSFYNHEPFDSYILNSRSFINSYKIQLSADFNPDLNRKTLYLSNGLGNVDALDLVKKTATTLIPSSLTSTTTEDHKYAWSNSSMTLVKGSNDQNTLLLSKRFPTAANLSWHAPFVGFVAQLPVRSDSLLSPPSSFMGNVTNNAPATNGGLVDKSLVAMDSNDQYIKLDSQKFVYVSGPQFKITTLDPLAKTQVLALAMYAFVVVEKDPTTKLIIYTTTAGGTLRAVELDSTKFFTAQNPISMASKKLCLPGTTIGWAFDLTTDDDGNLIISDTRKGRILKYRIRQQDGTLKMNYCP
jgi:hypothetical protein